MRKQSLWPTGSSPALEWVFSHLNIVVPYLIPMALGKHVLQANAFCVSLPVPNW